MTKKEILKLMIEKLLLMPYIWGGYSPILTNNSELKQETGLDCSGGVQILMESVGLDPKGDQTANAYFQFFAAHDDCVSVLEPEFGDLVFFGSDDRVTHVAMAMNKNLMFEFGGGGSKTKTVNDAVRDQAYGRIRLIANRRDLYAIIGIQKLLEG